MTHAVRFLLLAACTVPIGPAQVIKSDAGSITPGSSGTGSNPGGGQPSANPTTPITTARGTGESSRPIFISGNVMVDDGSPLPSNVTIQRLCGSNARAVAYPDGSGHFSFQWGKSNNVMADASEAGGRSSGGFGSAQSTGASNPLSSDPYGNQMINCELRANAAGYRSDTVNLSSRNPMDNPDIGTLVLHRLANGEGSSVSATSFLAPKDAKKAYEKGLDSLMKLKYEDAAKDFSKAVEVYPKYADAWANLGTSRLRQQALEPAREAFLKAIEADAKLVVPYVELGLIAAQEKKWDVSSQYLDRAVRLDPNGFPQAWYGNAVANYNLKKYDMAEKSAREAVRLDPNHVNPRADYLLALALIAKHDYTGAAAELKNYMAFAPDAPDIKGVREQLNRLEKSLADAQTGSQQ